MVKEKTIAERLRRFEAIACLSYSEETAQIWWEKFKDWDNDKFCCLCGLVEEKIKFHILPTLRDIIEEGKPRWKSP